MMYGYEGAPRCKRCNGRMGVSFAVAEYCSPRCRDLEALGGELGFVSSTALMSAEDAAKLRNAEIAAESRAFDALVAEVATTHREDEERRRLGVEPIRLRAARGFALGANGCCPACGSPAYVGFTSVECFGGCK